MKLLDERNKDAIDLATTDGDNNDDDIHDGPQKKEKNYIQMIPAIIFLTGSQGHDDPW